MAFGVGVAVDTGLRALPVISASLEMERRVVCGRPRGPGGRVSPQTWRLGGKRWDFGAICGPRSPRPRVGRGFWEETRVSGPGEGRNREQRPTTGRRGQIGGQTIRSAGHSSVACPAVAGSTDVVPAHSGPQVIRRPRASPTTRLSISSEAEIIDGGPKARSRPRRQPQTRRTGPPSEMPLT